MLPVILASVIAAQPRIASLPPRAMMLLLSTVSSSVFCSERPKEMKALLELVTEAFDGVTSAVTPETTSSDAAPELIHELPVNDKLLTVRELAPSTALMLTLLRTNSPLSVIVIFLFTSTASPLTLAMIVTVCPAVAALTAAWIVSYFVSPT